MTDHDAGAVIVHRTRDRTEAGMIRCALEDAGVPCRVDDSEYVAMELGARPACAGLPLCLAVPARLAERARLILAGMDLLPSPGEGGTRP